MHDSDECAMRPTCPRPCMHAPQPFSTWRSSDNTSADDLKGHDIALSRGPSKLLTLRQIEIHEFSCVEPFRLISESLLVAAFGGGLDRPSEELFSASITLLLSVFSLAARAPTKKNLALTGSTPSRPNQTLGPCAKVLKWGVVPT